MPQQQGLWLLVRELAFEQLRVVQPPRVCLHRVLLELWPIGTVRSG